MVAPSVRRLIPLVGVSQAADLKRGLRLINLLSVLQRSYGDRVELLRLSKAAKRLGVHPVTLRLWADSGKIPVTWVGRGRRFSSIDAEAMKDSTGGERVRMEGLYVRASGSHGPEFSLQAQEKELGATSTGEIVKVFRDRACGLWEDRPGLSL
ncbi:helix-turn-helix domain-containing protein, partial [Streptomyces sp. NPDC055722]